MENLYKQKTIKSIMDGIVQRKICLPAIQRKFIWSDEQITRLFDSLLRGYPIGTFLFWKVKKKNIKSYSIYDFICDFHELKNFQNEKSTLISSSSLEDKLSLVLDGQQRLNSLYISLCGSVSRKKKNKRRDRLESYEKKELYFKVNSGVVDPEDSENESLLYKFLFMSENDKKFDKDNGNFWIKVKEIFSCDENSDVYELLRKNHWESNKLISKNINDLWDCLCRAKKLNYYEVDHDNIDEVLDIFIRVNSAGTVLSKSDLLFSTIVSFWDDGRDKIDEFITTINQDGYNFNIDFIMRACLYLLDMNIDLKVDSFTENNVIKIKKYWEGKDKSLSKAILKSIKIINKHGFTSENITATLAILPIAYYLFHNNMKPNSKDEDLIIKYFINAQLKQIFGAAANSALKNIRKAQSKNKGSSFNYKDLENVAFTGAKTLKITEEEIKEMIESYEKGPYTFMLLSLLYPNFKYDQTQFHQDHMHPHVSFEKNNIDKNLNGLTLTEDQKSDWRNMRNKLPNLQILEGKENSGKNKTPLVKWLEDKNNLANVKYLPENISYEFKNFVEFYNLRKQLLIQELNKILL